jgi:anti-anti-sigma regulatory factor
MLVALLRGSRDDVAVDYGIVSWPVSGADWVGPPVNDQQITIKVESVPGSTTVFIEGELDLVTRPALAGELAQILREPPGRLVFDLAGTTFADLGSARLLARAGSPDCPPVIRHPRPGVRRILELAGLDTYCEIQP